MTIHEIEQKLAIDKIVETGIGLVSEKTYADIFRALIIVADEEIPADMTIMGVRIFKNPFIPDGEIWPFEKWDLRPKLPREFPL